MGRSLRLVAAIAFFVVGLPPSAHAATHPDSITQPPKDGCGRDPIELITTGRTAQWTYVNRDPLPKYIRGTVVISRPTETDNFRAHNSYDMNWNVRPLPQYESFLSTANEAKSEGLERDTIHNEWEDTTYPLFAWPTVGDDIEMLGSWIWDCGHWSAGNFADPVQGPLYLAPGTQPGEAVTGEKTELHPLRMIVVHRHVPSTSDIGGTVADAIISSKGTVAKGNEDWAAGICVQVRFEDCSQWQPVNDRNYSFDVQAPPKPPGATHIVYRTIDKGSTNAPNAKVTITSKGIHVGVPFKGWGKTGDTMVFAKSFEVGWDRPPPLMHYRLTFSRFKWLAELDGPETGSCTEEIPCTGSPQFSLPPDEVNMFVDVDGQWNRLQPPGLGQAKPGEVFPLDEHVDLYVSKGTTWRVLGRARECDQPGIAECPSTGEIGFNNDGGISEQHFHTGASDVAGTHVDAGVSGDCTKVRKGPCYELTYKIDDLGVVNAAAITNKIPLPRTDGTGTMGLAIAGIAIALGAAAIRPRRTAGTVDR